MEARRVYGSRLGRLSTEVRNLGLDGVIVVPGPNMRYLTGVQSLLLERPFLLLIPASGTPSLVSPAFEAGPYRRCPVELKVHDWTDSQGPSLAIAAAVKEAGLKGRWGVEGRAPFLYLHKVLEQTRVEFEDAEPVLQGLREVKDQSEVELMKKSAKILSDAYEEFPGFVEEGMTENELAKEAGDAILNRGATGVLDLLVQSGEAAADPHHLPSKKKIRRGESIVVDSSSAYEGYYADVTRTFCLGSSKKIEEVYSAVLAAQESAIAKAAEGVVVGDVDAAARDVLEKAGLGGYFTHRTGHGLGLEVHEAPYIVSGGKERLRRGMFFTVEPGAYLSGKLGVRIEDDVMISGKKAIEITTPPKEYRWWM